MKTQSAALNLISSLKSSSDTNTHEKHFPHHPTPLQKDQQTSNQMQSRKIEQHRKKNQSTSPKNAKKYTLVV